ncbi:MAG: ribosome assembly RNA-binding protein YhbY [Pseudomonadota bacterium]|nr:ribosome assembly RNA-binding protein YhbY [Pseudomonadota bacterium]
MEITASRKKQLRRKAHHLKPAVLIGQKGLTPAVVAAVEEGLSHHELIKVRFGGCDRGERDRIASSLIGATDATSVQQIGFTLTLFRRNEEHPKIRFAD